jgi:hypothetical protein
MSREVYETDNMIRQSNKQSKRICICQYRNGSGDQCARTKQAAGPPDDLKTPTFATNKVRITYYDFIILTYQPFYQHDLQVLSLSFGQVSLSTSLSKAYPCGDQGQSRRNVIPWRQALCIEWRCGRHTWKKEPVFE